MYDGERRQEVECSIDGPNVKALGGGVVGATNPVAGEGPKSQHRHKKSTVRHQHHRVAEAQEALTQGNKNAYTKKIIFFCNKKNSYTKEQKCIYKKKKKNFLHNKKIS